LRTKKAFLCFLAKEISEMRFLLFFLLFANVACAQTNENDSTVCEPVNPTIMELQDNGRYTPKNVLGGDLEVCCTSPMTGFYRDGRCETGPQDRGIHVVCAIVTKEFLEYSKSRGNDLMTPNPYYSFPGLKPGDGWCLCASRWKEAYDAGVAPKVKLDATHEAALRIVSLDILKEHAINVEQK
jgi:uncharacterized protein (DUF2237 family)